MKGIYNLSMAFGIGLLLLPALTYAAPIIRGSETVSVDASQTLEGDFYGFGSVITLSGPAEHDVHLAGGTITVNAPVAADLTAVAGAVQIHSDIGDDLRVLGGEVTLGGVVKGDVAVVGGILTILSTARVEGDVLFFGGSLVIEGDVNGTVHGYAETARINAAIGGDVAVTAPQGLTLHDLAHIQGGITYESTKEISRAQNAVVEGEIIQTDPGVEDAGGFPKGLILLMLALLFMSASLHLIARKRVERFAHDAYTRAGPNGLIGLALFLVLPFISGILFISIVGAPLGALALIAYFGLLVLAVGLTIILLGYGAQRLIFKRDMIHVGTLLLGVALTIMLTVLPVVGPFALFAALLISMGTVSTRVFLALRR